MTEIRKLKPDEISVKVKQITEKGCLLILYKTARVDAQILDETFGAVGWVNDFKEIKGNLFCGIGIKQEDGSFLWRWDCGVESATEAEKGEASDAFKRAGFKWGIGKELYSSPFIWANVETAKDAKGGYALKDMFMKFKVASIAYQGDKISSLTIVNNKGETVYPASKKPNPAPQEKTPVSQQQTPPPPPQKKTLEERIAAFREYLETATLEGMNGDSYKKTFKELCLLAGPEKSEELTKLHNNRFQFLMQQPLEKE